MNLHSELPEAFRAPFGASQASPGYPRQAQASSGQPRPAQASRGQPRQALQKINSTKDSYDVNLHSEPPEVFSKFNNDDFHCKPCCESSHVVCWTTLGSFEGSSQARQATIQPARQPASKLASHAASQAGRQPARRPAQK